MFIDIAYNRPCCIGVTDRNCRCRHSPNDLFEEYEIDDSKEQLSLPNDKTNINRILKTLVNDVLL